MSHRLSKVLFFAAAPEEGDHPERRQRRPQQEEAGVDAEVGWDCSLGTTEEESKALLITIQMIYPT